MIPLLTVYTEHLLGSFSRLHPVGRIWMFEACPSVPPATLQLPDKKHTLNYQKYRHPWIFSLSFPSLFDIFGLLYNIK